MNTTGISLRFAPLDRNGNPYKPKPVDIKPFYVNPDAYVITEKSKRFKKTDIYWLPNRKKIKNYQKKKNKTAH